MTKTLAALIATAMLLLSPLAAAEIKIASIQSAKLIKESPQYKRMESQMKADFESRAKSLESEAKKLQKDLADFSRDRDVMSDAERNRMEKELNTRRIDFNYNERRFKEDLATRERELASTLMKQISEVIERVAKGGKYDLVLQDPVYAGPAVDITDQVLQQLDR